VVVEIDTRHPWTAALPRREGLPPREQIPEILRDTPPAVTAGIGGARSSLRALPPAGMPAVVDGTRTEARQLAVYCAIDMSGSNETTDPRGARHQDVAFMARDWAARVIPDDVIVPVLFSDAARVHANTAPDRIPKDGYLRAPVPGRGGTRFQPAVQAIVSDAALHPDRAALVVLLSDGIPNDDLDIARASALLEESGVPAVLIPYGDEFPWLSAKWERTAFQVAKHVSDRRLAIAQTIALAVVAATGHRRADG
jgi:hypothetical protein